MSYPILPRMTSSSIVNVPISPRSKAVTTLMISFVCFFTYRLARHVFEMHRHYDSSKWQKTAWKAAGLGISIIAHLIGIGAGCVSIMYSLRTVAPLSGQKKLETSQKIFAGFEATAAIILIVLNFLYLKSTCPAICSRTTVNDFPTPGPDTEEEMQPNATRSRTERVERADENIEEGENIVEA